MAARKRSVEVVLLPEASVPHTVVRAFTSRDQLHPDIDWKRVNQGFGGQVSSFLRVAIMSHPTSDQDRAGGRAGSINRSIGNIPADVHVVVGDFAAGLPVGRNQRSCPNQKRHVPPQIRFVKRTSVQTRLVAANSADGPVKYSPVLPTGRRWVGRLGRESVAKRPSEQNTTVARLESPGRNHRFRRNRRRNRLGGTSGQETEK